MGTISDRLSDAEFELEDLTKGRKFMVIAGYDDNERNNLEIVEFDLDWEDAVALAEKLNLAEENDPVVICEHNRFMYW